MKKNIKNLTFILPLLFSTTANASDVFNQTQFETHLRWSLFASKNDVQIKKNGLEVELKTSNLELFNELKKEFALVGQANSYISKLEVTDIDLSAGKMGAFTLTLANDDVELFSFYRDSEQKYVLDFWVDQDLVQTKKAAPIPAFTPKAQEIKKVESPKAVAKKVAPKKAQKPDFKPLTASDKQVQKNLEEFRDFRYGATFIWDYEALSPELSKIVNVARKTPEVFYPIKDREFNKNEREAHLQLSINLFRKEKWGLMYKSIKLFEQKFGDTVAADLNDYLRANAILKDAFAKGKGEPEKVAINILTNISERTTNYDLKKGVLKYLVTYYVEKDDYIHALDFGKKMYVATREQFDIEESDYAAEVMLHSLAQLEQIDVLKNLLNDKKIKKQVNVQERLAYESYAYLKMGNYLATIKLFEENQRSLTNPIHDAILFNTAEAYFRDAQYDKANKLFDEYLTHYSHKNKADESRVRMALGYELSGKDAKQTLALYKNAINRVANNDLNYEARLRYVALNSIRRLDPNASELETRVFAENNYGSNYAPSNDLKKLLWQVRLRSLITDGEFDKALSYLNAIPLESMKLSEKTVFNADGAEVVYGIILDNYKQSNYSKIVQIFEVYKNIYTDKVALDPYLNFIVGHAYVKLGLFGGFDSIYANFEKLKNTTVKTYPLWVERTNSANADELLAELQVVRNIKLNNLEVAYKNSKDIKNNMKFFYQGIINYRLNKYQEAVEAIENYLSKQQGKSVYDPNDVAEMISAYTNSIYELGDLDKFKLVADAVLHDTLNFAGDNKLMNSVKERISYLVIETLCGESSAASYLAVESKINEFLNAHPKSEYAERVSYLKGVTLVANQKTQEGIKVFDELLGNKEVSEYIKGMVRAEKALLKIKERTI